MILDPGSPTVGVDVGATTIKAALVSAGGELLTTSRRPTPVDDPVAIDAAIVATVADVASAVVIGAVGVGTPGWTSSDRRTVVYSPNLPWRNEPLADRLADHLGVRVVLENDANAAAWGEFRYGAGRGVDSLVALTLGSGVGGSVIVNGALVRGAHGCAGEIGHCRQETGGRPCACGRQGCNENYASGRALTRRGVEAIGADTDLFTAATAGDADALAVYREFGTYVGRALADPVLITNPGLVVIGGGVADAFGLFGAVAAEALVAELGPNWAGIAPPLVPAVLGGDAGMIGAADLAREAA